MPWADRKRIDGRTKPAVYILARFEHPPSGTACPLTEEIIYFGETCSQTLSARWNQFNRSAFQGKFAHSGGWTYREEFGDDGHTLYVAAWPVDGLPKELQPHFIRVVERKLIWEYILKWERPPTCNRK